MHVPLPLSYLKSYISDVISLMRIYFWCCAFFAWYYEVYYVEYACHVLRVFEGGAHKAYLDDINLTTGRVNSPTENYIELKLRRYINLLSCCLFCLFACELQYSDNGNMHIYYMMHDVHCTNIRAVYFIPCYNFRFIALFVLDYFRSLRIVA